MTDKLTREEVMKEQLLSCPFCGGEASVEEVEIFHDSTEFTAGCGTEHCMGRQSMTLFARRSDAVKAWNMRSGRKPSADVIKKIVDKFLAWPLPDSVNADPCASMPNYPHRSGTNLLTATEAEKMITDIFFPELQEPPK